MNNGWGIVRGSLERQEESVLNLLDQFVDQHSVNKAAGFMHGLVAIDQSLSGGPMPSLQSLVELHAEFDQNQIDLGGAEFKQTMDQISQTGAGHIADYMADTADPLSNALAHQKTLHREAVLAGEDPCRIEQTIELIERQISQQQPEASEPVSTPIDGEERIAGWTLEERRQLFSLREDVDDAQAPADTGMEDVQATSDNWYRWISR